MDLHFPVTVHIAKYPVLLHGIMEFFGIFIAFRYYIRLKTKNGDHIEKYDRLVVIIGAALGAVIGSRIVGSLEDVNKWIAAASPLKYFYGNKTLVGGLLGGLAGVELAKKIIREQRNTGDLFVFPLLLGMIIGRTGCFSAGIYEETYGIASQLPWAIDLGDGILRHPVTIYEIIFLILLWVVLAFTARNYRLQEGALFKLFLIAYLVFRFALDFIKPGQRYFAGLGTIQLTCLAGLVYYAKYILQPSLLITSKETNAC